MYVYVTFFSVTASTSLRLQLPTFIWGTWKVQAGARVCKHCQKVQGETRDLCCHTFFCLRWMTLFWSTGVMQLAIYVASMLTACHQCKSDDLSFLQQLTGMVYIISPDLISHLHFQGDVVWYSVSPFLFAFDNNWFFLVDKLLTFKNYNSVTNVNKLCDIQFLAMWLLHLPDTSIWLFHRMICHTFPCMPEGVTL